MEGVRQVLKTDLGVRLCFLAPPDMAELERRLRARGTETEEQLQARLAQAEREVQFGRGMGGKVIVNRDVDVAYRELEEWILGGDL